MEVCELRCKHKFHTKCIQEWRKSRGDGAHRLCPNCRQPIVVRNPPQGLDNSLELITGPRRVHANRDMHLAQIFRREPEQ
jgi:hypothetical protein